MKAMAYGREIGGRVKEKGALGLGVWGLRLYVKMRGCTAREIESALSGRRAWRSPGFPVIFSDRH